MSRPKGFKHSPETIRKIAASNLGKKRSSSSKEKMASAKRGKPGPGASRSDWAPMRGKSHSDETKAKMRAAAKGRKTPFVKWIEYEGGKYRSHWEIRFLKAMRRRGFNPEYEPKRFDLGDTTYTPDFYIPETDSYWEVKGYMGPYSRNKIEKFRDMYPETPLIVVTKNVLDIVER